MTMNIKHAIFLLLAVGMCIGECAAVPASAASVRKPHGRNTASAVSENHAPAADSMHVTLTAQTSAPVDCIAETPVAGTALTPAQMDSLVACWNSDMNRQSFDRFYENFISPESMSPASDEALPDSVYVSRLRALASPVQLPYNAVVKDYILRYTGRGRAGMGRILSLSQYYFPMIEEELLCAGLPVELRVLPVIESALNPVALSRSGASGLWQFMPSTGRLCGLEINSLVDERRDPVSATRAACRFLKDLYGIYNDWSLVLAAYNCGPGNVNKAIARAGSDKVKSFWDIYEYLPAETRGYVPAFIGASYACAYHRLHDIAVEPSPLPVAVDTVTVSRIMHLEQVSSTLDLPLDVLRKLNPQYKEDIIPATVKSYSLVLPQQFVTNYISREEEIFSKDSLYLKEYVNPANIERKRLEHGITYTVKNGDTLSGIARRYRVSVREIMKWNNLRSDRLRIGQRLRIERAR